MELAKQKTIDANATKLEYIAAYMSPYQDDLLAAGHALQFKLQQTLDIESLLSTFCEESAAIIPCASVAFRNDQHQLFVYFGEKHQHTCRYTLEIDHQELGQIECSSPTAFTEHELMRVEHMLSLLLFPLRNALLYHAAVESAQRDPLTQLSNRSAFNAAIEAEISRAQRQGNGLCMLVVDIDHFKSINDNYGHLAGDQILKEVAERLKSALRKEDRVFRFGGEEFVILLSATPLPAARLTAERVRMTLCNTPMTAMDLKLSISASIGVSEWQMDENSSTLFHRADQALYSAKEHGRNQVKVA
ncbi:GGDEF domain-containing protein [Pleionea litopenaei]|uniref:diguanylate cyclase n=1 Tax=Pleionea litopenaei TaxID=3070815 RepID=A0AA51X6U3_9GAMM|nr:GGDEF domain-containing protein [Pleionea sp. HL-JVS1]WMS87219.1 GGDEF domain-containing protein [Pleionea sp. HL-JVS1]